MKYKIDLSKILKNCPIGWKFWSPIFGEVEFEHIFENKDFIKVKASDNGSGWAFNYDATFFLGNTKSKEIMLYPSKDQRDWSKFTAPWYKKEKFDPKTLKPFDTILVRRYDDVWMANLFSHYCNVIHPVDPNIHYLEFITITNETYRWCIPYNDDTKHLVGKTEKAPEYYRYWE